MAFATKVYEKFDKVVKAVVLFGSSTKNTASSSSDVDIIIIIDDVSIDWDQELIAWFGREETTEAKMINDIPLPIPFWLINSPIHMSKAVPAVRVRTTSATRGAVNLGRRSSWVPLLGPLPNPPPPLWKRNANAVD